MAGRGILMRSIVSTGGKKMDKEGQMTILPAEEIGGAKIRVVGVGGGGGNALDTMIESGLEGVEFIAANTDLQALEKNMATCKIQLGNKITKGLGAGADPKVGRDSALADTDRITEVLQGADMVFITAGMGGGTGTGGAPIIAKVAKELKALTVGVVTKPFTFEGKKRTRQAEEGIRELKKAVDTLIVIPNQRLLAISRPNMSILESFKLADTVLLQAARGISDIICTPGIINVDFRDVKTIMNDQGLALMGTGTATMADLKDSGSTSRALYAAKQAIESPLLEEVTIEGAMGILVNVTGGDTLSLLEVSEAIEYINEACHEDANIIFGAVIDEKMGDEVKITVIATGFDTEEDRPWKSTPLPTAQKQNYDIPTYIRRGNRENLQGTEGVDLNQKMGPGISSTEESELAIPTFLRRRHD